MSFCSSVQKNFCGFQRFRRENNLLIQSKNTHEVSRKKSEQPMWAARSILVEIKELENYQLSIASVEPTAS